MALTAAGFVTKLRTQFAPLCLIIIALAVGCDKTSQDSILVSSSDGPEFREITNRVKQTPSFAMSDEPKEIKLEIYSKFDGEEITSRVMSVTEWNDLKHVLQGGTEVENTKLLALSASLEFENDNHEPINLTFYWTSDSGDVYFFTERRWFNVSDRSAVRRAINGRGNN
jgi:hypothetical protein